MTNSQHSVCVFCGSRSGDRPAYRAAAEAIGSGIATSGWQLVYGAGDVGLMGAVADAAVAAGGRTMGVIPVHLLPREGGKRDLTRFVVTETMHERKKVMVMNSDALVILPGGAGTLDEFFEVLTWRQLGLHAKPIIIADIEGYWAPLTALIDGIIAGGFADASLRDYVEIVDSAEAVLALLRAKMA